MDVPSTGEAGSRIHPPRRSTTRATDVSGRIDSEAPWTPRPERPRPWFSHRRARLAKAPLGLAKRRCALIEGSHIGSGPPAQSYLSNPAVMVRGGNGPAVLSRTSTSCRLSRRNIEAGCGACSAERIAPFEVPLPAGAAHGAQPLERPGARPPRGVPSGRRQSPPGHRAMGGRTESTAAKYCPVCDHAASHAGAHGIGAGRCADIRGAPRPAGRGGTNGSSNATLNGAVVALRIKLNGSRLNITGTLPYGGEGGLALIE
jgi:hypothetical protein